MARFNWSSVFAMVFGVAAITSVVLGREANAVTFAVLAVAAAIMAHLK